MTQPARGKVIVNSDRSALGTNVVVTDVENRLKLSLEYEQYHKFFNIVIEQYDGGGSYTVIGRFQYDCQFGVIVAKDNDDTYIDLEDALPRMRDAAERDIESAQTEQEASTADDE